MWSLFAAWGQESPEEEETEDAEELRLKIEAMRAADYREQLRASCQASKKTKEEAAPQQKMDSEGGTAPGRASAAGDLERKAGGEGEGRTATEVVLLRRIRAIEKEQQENEAKHTAQLEAQEQKLVTASKALRRAKGQVQQITAQLHLKEIQSSRLEAQVSHFRNLLVEKEKRLQAALDQAAAASAAAVDANKKVASLQGSLQAHKAAALPAATKPASDGSTEADGEDRSDDGSGHGAADEGAREAQQPQEPPMTPPGSGLTGTGLGAVPLREEDEEQLVQLSRLTEELAGALQTSKANEEETQHELAATAAQLEKVEAQRQLFESELSDLRQRYEAEADEAGTLRATLDARERWYQQRASEYEERIARVRLEGRLKNAMEQRGQVQKFHPHFEV